MSRRSLAESLRRNEITIQIGAYTGNPTFVPYKKSLDELEAEYGEKLRLAFEDLASAYRRCSLFR